VSWGMQFRTMTDALSRIPMHVPFPQSGAGFRADLTLELLEKGRIKGRFRPSSGPPLRSAHAIRGLTGRATLFGLVRHQKVHFVRSDACGLLRSTRNELSALPRRHLPSRPPAMVQRSLLEAFR